jgi:hypothetical protein
LDALNEEKDKVLRSNDASITAVATIQTEINKVKEAIDTHQKVLEQSARPSTLLRTAAQTGVVKV